MKTKAVFIVGMVLAYAGTSLAAQQLALDEGLAQIGKAVEGKLPAGSNLAVLNFSSESEAFSNYVVEELTGILVMNGKLSVIERRSLDLIRSEMNLHLSGNVSDDSAMAIGKQLGARGIVTGSLTNMGSFYRFRIKVINVETARIEAQLSFNLRNDEQVAFLLHGNQGTAPPVAATPAPAPASTGVSAGSTSPATGSAIPAPAPAGQVYKIGDKGPAGGLIFYDKGNSTDGWRYLEAAPASTEFIAHCGNIDSVPGVTGTAVGIGRNNTRILARYMREKGQEKTAALLCDDFEFGEYTDWFLPSKDELNLMYVNLEKNGLGSFKVSTYYWSSSGGNTYDVWVQRFSDGRQTNGSYWSPLAVRAVRAF